jgi:hypothetical protein
MKAVETMNVLNEAVELLGPPVKVEQHRGWAIFWCPFHEDAARRGRRGQPNFGVQLDQGYWKCLRCGASGSNIPALRKKLGIWRTPPAGATSRRVAPLVNRLNEALSEARAALPGSPAERYITQRGLRPFAALNYGLGYGVPLPNVHLEVVQAARQARLVANDGRWLWAGGLVYADPPVNPVTIQVRHLRPEGGKKYQTWGRLTRPLGSWRFTTATRTVIVSEGLLDMLVIAQALRDRREDGSTGAIYTGGASPSRPMLEWFAACTYEFLLVPDPDEAGQGWARALKAAIRRGEGQVQLAHTPDGLDPDQAVLSGWWPEGV